MERFVGRVAVVTGSSSGIGASIAQQLAIKGLKVVGLARRVGQVEKLASDLPKNAIGTLKGIKCSVTNAEEIHETFNWIENNIGPITILINNAGVLRDVNFQGKNNINDWRDMLETNVLGLSICTRYALQMMHKHQINDGHIVNINSDAGHTMPDVPELTMYYATKHAVTVLTEGLRKELVKLDSKIRTTSISPGYVETEIFKSSDVIKPEYLPLPSLQPNDVSDAIIYALSAPKHVNVSEIIIKPVGQVT